MTAQVIHTHVTLPPGGAGGSITMTLRHAPDALRPDVRQEDIVRILKPVLAAAKGDINTDIGILSNEPHADMKVRGRGYLRRVVWGRFRGEGRAYRDAALAFLRDLSAAAVTRANMAGDMAPKLLPLYRERLDTLLAAINAAIDTLSPEDT